MKYARNDIDTLTVARALNPASVKWEQPVASNNLSSGHEAPSFLRDRSVIDSQPDTLSFTNPGHFLHTEPKPTSVTVCEGVLCSLIGCTMYSYTIMYVYVCVYQYCNIILGAKHHYIIVLFSCNNYAQASNQGPPSQRNYMYSVYKAIVLL